MRACVWLGWVGGGVGFASPTSKSCFIFIYLFFFPNSLYIPKFGPQIGIFLAYAHPLFRIAKISHPHFKKYTYGSGWRRGGGGGWVGGGGNLVVILVRVCEPVFQNLPYSYTWPLKKRTHSYTRSSEIMTHSYTTR